MAVQRDGMIVVAGSSPDSQTSATDAYFARYTSGGLGVAVSEPDVSPQSLALTFNGSAIGTAPIAFSGGDTDDGGSAAGVEIQGSFTDPGTVQEPHVVTIAWGDGSTPVTFDLDAGQTSFDYPLPQYAAPGTYTVSVTVANLDGSGSLTQSFTVNYTNSQPSGLVLSLDQSTITAGDQVNLSGSFTDPQWNIAHTVTIDWGDGTESSPDVTTLSLDPGETTFQADPQTYNTPAADPYTIHVTVSGLDGSATATTPVTVNPVPDVVMIGSLVPAASEYRGIPGEFLVSRAGPTTSNLTVTYTVSGNGLAGTDYAAGVLTGSVAIPAGDTSVMLPVDPIERFLSSGYKSVIVTLSSGSGYSVASSCSQALVKIWDDYNPDLSGPGVTKITCFNPNGTETGNYGSAILGDFIPIGVNAPSGDYTDVQFTLSYSSTLVVCTGSDGSGVVPSGSTISLYKSYTIYYVFAAASTPDDESGGEQGTSGGSSSGAPVCGEMTLLGPSDDSSGGSGGPWQPCSAQAELDPPQLYRTGVSIDGASQEVDITNGSAGSSDPKVAAACNVKVGERINLTVGAGEAPDIPSCGWAIPGYAVADYDPYGSKSVLTPLSAVIENDPCFVSFAWVDSGTKAVSVEVTTPWGERTVQATFTVIAPDVKAKALFYNGSGRIPNPIGFGTTSADGVNGVVGTQTAENFAELRYGGEEEDPSQVGVLALRRVPGVQFQGSEDARGRTTSRNLYQLTRR